MIKLAATLYPRAQPRAWHVVGRKEGRREARREDRSVSCTESSADYGQTEPVG